MSVEEKPAFRVLVQAGPDQGRLFPIPASGARLGRSSQNDIALTDPLLSRHHCRFERRGGELWVVDLASANQTLVGGKAVDECRLQPGETVTVGDSILRVVPPDVSAPAEAAAAPVIDLGLAKPDPAARGESRHVLRPLLWAVAAAVVLIAGTVTILTDRQPNKPAPRSVPEPQDLTLQIAYEKIEADPEGIFRYEMTLTPQNLLAIRIDDLKQNRHVRNEKTVDRELIHALAADILSSGFFKLDPSYAGINSRQGGLDSWDLTIAVGRNVWHCRVTDRLEPEVFKAVREKIETFGKNELGIWAIQFSRDRLVDLANEAYRVGRRNLDERDIRYGNLFDAIQRYREMEFYLETVEPKPEFYADGVSDRQRAMQELDRRFQDQNVRCDLAIKLGNWQNAAQELRILRELVPDRGDDRYKEATRKLLDVEARLKARSR